MKKPDSIKAALFDLDGTLLDSMGMWEQAGEVYLREKGFHGTPEMFEALRTVTIEEAGAILRDHYHLEETPASIAAGINAVARRYYAADPQVKPGAAAFLARLKERGIRCCLCTATDRDLAELALSRCGLTPYFEAICTCTEVGAAKEKPDVFLRGAALLGAAAEETVVFEDSYHAILTARRAGFFVVAVRDPHAVHPEEIAHLADRVISSFDEL